jgi:hypothetical protein
MAGPLGTLRNDTCNKPEESHHRCRDHQNDANIPNQYTICFVGSGVGLLGVWQ